MTSCHGISGRINAICSPASIKNQDDVAQDNCSANLISAGLVFSPLPMKAATR